MDYSFTNSAIRMLKRLPKNVQVRIVQKLDHFVHQEDPLQFAEHLVNYELGMYRYRVGDYRVVFDVEGDEIVVLAVGHRREIYK